MDLRNRDGFEASTPGGKALQVAHKMGVPVEWHHQHAKYWQKRNSVNFGDPFIPTNHYRMLLDENT